MSYALGKMGLMHLCEATFQVSHLLNMDQLNPFCQTTNQIMMEGGPFDMQKNWKIGKSFSLFQNAG